MVHNRFAHHLGGGSRRKLHQQLFPVPLHGFRTQTQVLCNLRSGPANGNFLQDGHLPPGQFDVIYSGFAHYWFYFFANFVYFNVLNTTLSGGSLHPKGLKMVGFYLVPLQL